MLNVVCTKFYNCGTIIVQIVKNIKMTYCVFCLIRLVLKFSSLTVTKVLSISTCHYLIIN